MNQIENSPKLYDIVIAGGNFTGLLLARALSVSSQNILNIAVIDPNDIMTEPKRSDDVRAFALSASSKQMLSILGIWPNLSEKANPITKIEITDSQLETVIKPVFTNFDNLTEEGKPNSYIIENTDLKKTIIDDLENFPNIYLFPLEKVSTFNETENNNFLEVKLEKSGNTISTKLLVAADGKNSSLREKANIKTVGWDYNQNGIVTRVRHSKPNNQKAIQHFLPAGPFAILPVSENEASIVWSETSSAANEIVSYNDEAFLAELKKRFSLQLGNIEISGPRKTFPLSLKLARELTKDRFVLIGDAAHGVHPIAGLGLNMGIRDIAALTQIIIENWRLGIDFGSSVSLHRYSQWRRFDNTISAFTMDALNRLFSNDNSIVRIIRDTGLGLIDKRTDIKNFFVKEASGLSGDIPKLLKGEKI